MKSWYIALIALFFIAFLALGRIFTQSPIVEDENTQSIASVSTESKTTKGVMIPPDPKASENIPDELFEKIKNVSLENIQDVFSLIEEKMNELQNPSSFLAQVLQIGDVKQKNQNLKMAKGYAINSFFQRVDDEAPFKPSSMVESSLSRLAEQDSSTDLATEAAGRLKEYFNYDRDKILQLIDGRSDRDHILENLF